MKVLTDFDIHEIDRKRVAAPAHHSTDKQESHIHHYNSLQAPDYYVETEVLKTLDMKGSVDCQIDEVTAGIHSDIDA